MRSLIAEGVRVDAIVTDPPYDLTSARPGGRSEATRGKVMGGFMGLRWDGTGVAFDPATWEIALDILKPGGHLLAFGGTRTYHRLACAIEDAGFEIRDQIGWVYGSGFPKSLDVSKAIDKAAGVAGTFGAPKSAAHAAWIDRGRMRGDDGHEGYQRPWMADEEAVERNARQYMPGSDAARQWAGWGTALKPAWEPIVVARKPLSEGNVAANVLKHGTGALNVDACRIEPTGESRERIDESSQERRYTDSGGANFAAKPGIRGGDPLGRWPANLAHDGSEEVLEFFPNAPGQSGAITGKEPSAHGLSGNMYGTASLATTRAACEPRGDAGSAARFFYCAKADQSERAASKHPTVKPLALMQWLVRLVAPRGALILDPFAGSGTTVEACMVEQMRFLAIEREAEYVNDIQARIDRVRGPLGLELA